MNGPDASVIYIGAFPILTALPGRRSIYNIFSRPSWKQTTKSRSEFCLIMCFDHSFVSIDILTAVATRRVQKQSLVLTNANWIISIDSVKLSLELPWREKPANNAPDIRNHWTVNTAFSPTENRTSEHRMQNQKSLSYWSILHGREGKFTADDT